MDKTISSNNPDLGLLPNKKPASMQAKKRRDKIFAYSILAWPLLHFLVFWLAMNVGTIWLSFNYGNSTVSYFNGLKNYENVLKVLTGQVESGINNHHSLWNTLSLIPLSLCINLPITLLFSFAIFRKIKGWRAYQIVLFIPAMISATVLCMSFKIFVDGEGSVLKKFLQSINLEKVIPPEGWFGNAKTAWPIMLIFSVWTGISTNIIYFGSSMSRVSDGVIESAQLDGASEIRIFAQIVLPMIWPTICTMSISIISSCFAWYMPSLLMSPTNANTTTLGLIIVATTKNAGANIGDAAALGVLIGIFGTIVIVTLRKLINRFAEEVEY